MLRAWEPSTGSLPAPMLDQIQLDRDRDPIKEQQLRIPVKLNARSGDGEHGIRRT